MDRRGLLERVRRRADALLSRALPPGAYDRIADKLQEGGYSADYGSWADAARHATGYDAHEISQKVRDALLKVKSGEAVAERDSVVLPHVEYSFPVMATLARAALRSGGELSVLDVGGSLGSVYFQFLSFGAPVTRLRWNIVEQPTFVAEGRQHFENDELRFFGNVASCLKETRPDVALFSSVLQYLSEPYALLKEVIEGDVQTLVVDRTFFCEGPSDRVVVQTVPAWIYAASYPCWFLSRSRFLTFMAARYRLTSQFPCLQAPDLTRANANLSGMIFER